MANIVMNVHNKKGGKGGKGNKDSDMNSFYNQRVDVAPTAATAAAAAAAAAIDVVPIATTAAAAAVDVVPIATAAVDVVPIATAAAAAAATTTTTEAAAISGSPQTIRTPSEDSKWKRVAKKSDAKSVASAAVNAPTKKTDEVPEEVAQRAESIRGGPPPVFRLNDDAPSEQKQMFDAMREFMATQQRMMEMMQMQLQAQSQSQAQAQAQAKQVAPPVFPFVPQFAVPPYHMPMMMPPPNWSAYDMQSPGDAPHAAPSAVPSRATNATNQHIREPRIQHAKKPANAADTTPEEIEFAPFELRLNDECLDGFNCPNSKKPFKCPKNHHKFGDIIKKDAKLPKFFCKWERPWKKGPNNKPLRCRNPECFFAHLEGRKDFIMKSEENASVENAE